MLPKLILLFLLAPFLTGTALQQSPTPEPRAGHELVWHAGLGMVLLVNGDHVSSNEPGLIWGWDAEAGAWQIVSDDAPPSRSLGGVAYDAAQDTLVLYGGSVSFENVSDETWVWDWQADTWQQFEGPGRRDHFAMAYAGDGIIVYGGQDTFNNEQWTDTWLWDGAIESWTQLATDGSGPVRYHYAYGYDSVRNRVLLFGGTDGGRDYNDLYGWDLEFPEGWQVLDAGTGPSPRSYARMAYHAASEMMVVFGGFTSSGPVNETWLWNGASWTEYESAVAPPARGFGAMAYDPIREKIVMFGGYADTNLGDTWEWDIENGWVEVTP